MLCPVGVFWLAVRFLGPADQSRIHPYSSTPRQNGFDFHRSSRLALEHLLDPSPSSAQLKLLQPAACSM
jgi:hypothetical protein